MMNDDNNMYVNNYQLKHLQCVVIVSRVFMSHETQITEARTPQPTAVAQRNRNAFHRPPTSDHGLQSASSPCGRWPLITM